MKAPSVLDRSLDGIYDVAGLLFIVKGTLNDLEGALLNPYQEKVVASAGQSLNIAIQILGTTIDGIESEAKAHTLVPKDGGGVQ